MSSQREYLFNNHTEWKVSKYGVISGPYFPVFGLNKEICGVNLRIQSNTGKYGPEITPYLDTFNALSYGIFPVPTNRSRLDLILSKHCRYCCTLENLICLNSEKFYHRVRKTYNLFTVSMLTLDVD